MRNTQAKERAKEIPSTIVSSPLLGKSIETAGPETLGKTESCHSLQSATSIAMMTNKVVK